MVNTETTLLELLNDNTRTALQVAGTHLALADVYLLKEDYDSAEKSCKDAIRNKAWILSRNHQSVCLSVGLLAQILEAKGSNHLAVAYKTLIPSEIGTPHHLHHANV